MTHKGWQEDPVPMTMRERLLDDLVLWPEGQAEVIRLYAIEAALSGPITSEAATLPDETILEWRNTGPTILAWIRTHQRPPCDDECEVAAVDDFAAWSGATTFGKVLQATGWRVEVFWNSSGGWFTARLISPWDRSGNADYPGGFLAPFDNPIGASGASPEEAVSHLADAVLEWS